MSSAGANMLSELRLGQTHKILLGVGFPFKYNGTRKLDSLLDRMRRTISIPAILRLLRECVLTRMRRTFNNQTKPQIPLLGELPGK